MTETSKKAQGDAATRRPRVMPDVTKALASDIFSGRYPAGSSLPTENDLGVEYGVSRTVIREALKVLAAKGLVLSRPRIGTVVCEQDNCNIIDPQVLAWHAPHALDDKLFDAILETRRAIEPPGIQRGQHVVDDHDRAARGIHQVRALLHEREQPAIDDAAR